MRREKVWWDDNIIGGKMWGSPLRWAPRNIISSKNEIAQKQSYYVLPGFQTGNGIPELSQQSCMDRN